MKYTKKHLQALADRVYQYECGIASNDPHSAVVDIMDYCGICESTCGEYSLWRECRKCGLGPKDGGCYSGVMNESRTRMRDAYEGKSSSSSAMKARLAAIISRCDENGIIFE